MNQRKEESFSHAAEHDLDGCLSLSELLATKPQALPPEQDRQRPEQMDLFAGS